MQTSAKGLERFLGFVMEQFRSMQPPIIIALKSKNNCRKKNWVALSFPFHHSWSLLWSQKIAKGPSLARLGVEIFRWPENCVSYASYRPSVATAGRRWVVTAEASEPWVSRAALRSTEISTPSSHRRRATQNERRSPLARLIAICKWW